MYIPSQELRDKVLTNTEKIFDALEPPIWLFKRILSFFRGWFR